MTRDKGSLSAARLPLCHKEFGMGWRRQIWGAEHPTLKRYVAMSFLYAALALCVYGILATFVPSPQINLSLFWSMLALSTLLMLWVTVRTLQGRNPNFRGSKARLIWFFPFGSVMLAALLWLALARGLGAGITRWLGTPTAAPPAKMWTARKHSRHECHLQLRGGPLADHFFQDHVCISTRYYHAHPGHRVRVQLIGRKTAWGFYITGFRHLNDLGPR